MLVLVELPLAVDAVPEVEVEPLVDALALKHELPPSR